MEQKRELDMSRIPVHVAVVMDGNGRWAKQKNLPRVAGHNAGMQSLKEIVKRASTLEIKYLTVYAFSTENWKRPEDEVSGIFKLLVLYMQKELAELHANNVKVNILGEYRSLPMDAVVSLEKSMETTRKNTGMQFNIALNYGSRDEILHATRRIVQDTTKGLLTPDQIDSELFSSYLYTGRIPDPDLVIRTSGEIRLSNYLLWQIAYSELVFTDVLWPDFTPECLEEAIWEFQNRKRRYGGIESK